MSRVRVQSQEQWHVEYPHTLGDTALLYHDDTKTRFEATVHYGEGNYSEIWVERWTDGGVRLGEWAVDVPRREAPLKHDSLAMAFLPTASGGLDLLVGGVAHDLSNFDYVRWIARVPNVLSIILSKAAGSTALPAEVGG